MHSTHCYMTTPAQVRQHLIDALQLDLIGPTPDDEAHAAEIINQQPSRWYLTGFLVPYGAGLEQPSDATSNDELDEHSHPSSGDDEKTPEKSSARRAFFPSSMGLSFLIPQQANHFRAIASWGDYSPIIKEEEAEAEEEEEEEQEKSEPEEQQEAGEQAEGKLSSLASSSWLRKLRQEELTVPIKNSKSPYTFDIPNSGGLKLVVSTRPVLSHAKLPPGTRSISAFIVNYRESKKDDLLRDTAYIFQTNLTVETPYSIVASPNLREQTDDDWDEKVADLQYRDDCEYAVGHNVSAIALVNPGPICHEIRTAWIPTADVEKVIAADIPGIELEIEAIAAASSPSVLRSMLEPMVTAYADWITEQHKFDLSPNRTQIAEDLLRRASWAGDRIAGGLNALNDPEVFEAFIIANRAIAISIRQRAIHDNDSEKNPAAIKAPKWRLFQIAFLLMNLTGIAEPEKGDREIVDLLFFPTGGGKTEAYLGLAAFTLVLRRLRNPGISGAGVSVLMRYTLRLLTLDQLSRAATLICALELERQKDDKKLGTWPFEIGLWVGQAATPNRMGSKGDKNPDSARSRTMAYQNDDRHKPSPIPLENCPWCGEKFTRDSFKLFPNADNPTDLRILCVNRKRLENGQLPCTFRGSNPLPIVAVDDAIYRRIPCFIIATVDKFANLPWVGETGALFGKVDRYDNHGFYGPSAIGIGRSLEKPLLPPDLIIQDELHLISGPLGTMVGLYETAIDALSAIDKDGKKIYPKIVASTATVRRATKQICALFGRTKVDIFPPPGPDRRDSFFAKTVPATVQNPRTYIGIAAQGRSLKVILLRTYLAVLGAAQKDWNANGGARNKNNPADSYMTLLGYFNSLRELGGSRRIVEDEVKSRLLGYHQRKRENEAEGSFVDRTINDEPLELTSRVNTSQISEAKRRLALGFSDKDRVDVALATNMISVGLDITRLGLMVVLGQPKTAAEYIQATSRVGRDEQRPGLAIALLNIHRPRDRSHYERFGAWHNTFYRAVEATSVTPFSPRAIDRGIAAIAVAIARLGNAEMTSPLNAVKIIEQRSNLDCVADIIAERSVIHDPHRDSAEIEELRLKIKGRVNDLLDTWQQIATEKGSLQYQQEVGVAPPLLFDPLDPELQRQPQSAKKFKAQRSLRDVEPVVNLWVKNSYELDLNDGD
jgi:hypothetical protein